MKKNNLFKIIRLWIQIICFILLPGLFIIIWNSIGDIVKYFVSGGDISGAIITLVCVIPITILVGRFFCGYMCSFGSLQEFINYIGKKLGIKQIKIEEDDHKYYVYIKYIILVFFIFLWIVGVDYSKYSPWSVFGFYTNLSSWSDFSFLFSIGGLLLLLIIIGSLFIERFFCRYLCPLGGIFSLISKFRVFKVKKRKDKCVGCSLCDKKCPMNISVNKETNTYGYVKSSECIDCFKCINTCYKDSLYTNPKDVAMVAITPTLIAGMYYAGNIYCDNYNGHSVVSGESIGNYKDGTYKGIGKGYRGDISVTVKVSGRKITSITIDSYRDDGQFFNKAKNSIIDEIISSQSLDVNVVSGATYSSRGIIEAVSNALGEEVKFEDEDFRHDKFDDRDKIKEDFSDEEKTSGLDNLKDGEYSGTGRGRNGDISVSVNVSDGKITSITILSSLEDAKYFNRAKDTIINEIISQQSLDVDTVSGATMSSRGIIEAVADALDVSVNFRMRPEGSDGFKGRGRHRRTNM